MADMNEIIAEMRAIAPPGQRSLDCRTTEQLRNLTSLLIDCDSNAVPEYERFIGVTRRELDLSQIKIDLRAAYEGKRILVTGGTGCIGSTLIRQLQLCEPAGLFVLSRGARHYDPIPGVVYLHCDVADEWLVNETVTRLKPDVVFHLAAQRSPWLAEREIAETVMTNVIGTRNVLRACRRAAVPRFIHASTGKAMRYYTTDIYAATKKLCEWLVQEYANEGHLAGSARFTHVVDNGVILQKIDEAMNDPHGIVRLHDADTAFYIQSAIESAQLLMLAGLNIDENHLRMVAIRCLGEPANLLSMTLGKIGAKSDHPPIYFSGFDKGYEKGTPPGLYDPFTAPDLSPLINAIEALSATEVDCVPAVDKFRLALPCNGTIEDIADDLAKQCRDDDPMLIAAGLAEAGKVVADAMFGECPENLFVRLNKMAKQAGAQLPCSREVKA